MDTMADKITGLDDSDIIINEKELEDIDYTYDMVFKKLFANVVFLAPVLKNIVPEYKHLELEDIESLVTTNSDVKVNPQVYNSEDFGKGEETTTHYDVLASCSLPDGETVCVGFYFDLEMQRESEPGYPVIKRGIYYCSRLVSRQIERLGKESYNQLKPVYSVWIMINNIPEGLENSIYTARLSGCSNKKDLDVANLNRELNLINLYLIYLSENFKPEEDQDDLVMYLQSVFAGQAGNKDCNPYYEYSSKIKKEAEEVMSIRESFEARGMARGMARGEVIGRAEGEIIGRIAILAENKYPDVKIINYLMTLENNPLTQEEAERFLKEYYKKYPV